MKDTIIAEIHRSIFPKLAKRAHLSTQETQFWLNQADEHGTGLIIQWRTEPQEQELAELAGFRKNFDSKVKAAMENRSQTIERELQNAQPGQYVAVWDEYTTDNDRYVCATHCTTLNSETEASEPERLTKKRVEIYGPIQPPQKEERGL